jgi:hypothetical protein
VRNWNSLKFDHPLSAQIDGSSTKAKVGYDEDKEEYRTGKV